MGKLKKNTGMAVDESQKQKWGDRWCEECRGSLSSPEFGVGAAISKKEGSSCTPRWRWLSVGRSINWAGIISITNDSSKKQGHFFKNTRIRRTSSKRSFRLYPCGNGRCTRITENSQIGMSRSSRSSWAKSVWSTLLQDNWERQVEKVPVGKKVSKLECLFVNRARGLLINVCGRYQIGRQDKKHRIDSEIFHERRCLGEPTSFLDHVSSSYTKRECQKDLVTKVCSAGVVEKYQKQKVQRNLMPKLSLHGNVTWKDMQWNAMKCVERSCLRRHVWMTTNLKKKKKKMNQFANCPQSGHKLFWHVHNWFVLVDPVCYGLWTSLFVRSQRHVTNL